jgi:hypothetical protein
MVANLRQLERLSCVVCIVGAKYFSPCICAYIKRAKNISPLQHKKPLQGVARNAPTFLQTAKTPPQSSAQAQTK